MKFGKAFRYFVLVVSAGLFFTLSTFSISYRWQIHQYEERFKKGSLIRAELITKYLSENLDELESLRLFFQSSSEVSLSEFQNYVRPILATKRGFMNISWSPRIEERERALFEKKGAVLLQGREYRIHDDRVTLSPRRPLHVPILFTDPENDDMEFPGLDNKAFPERRLAMERALMSGEASVTPPYDVKTDNNTLQRRFTIFLAVFRSGSAPSSLREREENCLGFISSSFQCEDLLSLSPSTTPALGLPFTLNDLSSPAEKGFIHRWAPPERRTVLSLFRPPLLKYRHVFSFTDRRWLLEIESGNAYRNDNAIVFPWLALLLGLAISLLGAFTTLSVLRKKEAALGLLRSRSEELDQEQKKNKDLREITSLVLQSTETGLTIVDEEYNLLYVSKNWERERGPWEGKRCFSYLFGSDTPCSVCPKMEEPAEAPLTALLRSSRGTKRVFRLTRLRYQSSEGERKYVQLYTDFSQREKSEEFLRLMDFIVNNSPGIFARWKNAPGWPAEYVSKSVSHFGYTPEELHEGVNLLPLIHAEDQEKIATALSLHREGVFFSQDFRLLNKSGQTRWVQGRALAEKDPSGNLSSFVGLFLDITDQRESQEKMRHLLEEKDLLLKEVHHRVKNNMAVVSSLLSLQSRHTKDPSVIALLKEAQSRIYTMQLLYDRLYRSGGNLSRVNLAGYIHDLVDNLFTAYNVKNDRIQLINQIPPVELNISQTVPLGLIVNELISNALKHAFPSDRSGTLSITFLREEGANFWTLRVADDGVGLPAGFDPWQSTGFGFQLISLLVSQLGGTIETRRDGGTSFTITLPIQGEEER